jgi:methylenetetrahydrofolate dehydrogenase (NADP+) / methenyltetrahydrofolate cyclohydrolase
MTPPDTRQISGARILQEVRTRLVAYREAILRRHQRVSVIRFAADPSDSPLWQRRMEASRVSAQQKLKAFSQLGFDVDHQFLDRSTSAADFATLIDVRNVDPATIAVIVQYPPPPHLASLVHRLTPAKDIDGLLGDRSPQLACATADGIARVVRPFTLDNPRIAVVGGQGFVGSGVVRLLHRDGLNVVSLDVDDDLHRTRDADIVVSATGRPHLLTEEHIRSHHRLVVDSGFMPQPDGSIAGDVAPSGQTIPQYITPVPGGIGPIEMAVLMDRVVRQVVDIRSVPWTIPRLPYLGRGELAALGNLAPATGAVGPRGKRRGPRNVRHENSEQVEGQPAVRSRADDSRVNSSAVGGSQVDGPRPLGE